MNPLELAHPLNLFSYANPERSILDLFISQVDSQIESHSMFAAVTPSSVLQSFALDTQTAKGKETLRYFKDTFPKVPLIDLGCGPLVLGDEFPGQSDQERYCSMPLFASHIGLPAYIGIDKWSLLQTCNPTKSVAVLPSQKAKKSVPRLQSQSFEIPGLDAHLIGADILDAVSRLSTGKFIFSAYGLDSNVWHNPDTYSLVLAQELERASAPGSYVMGKASELFWQLPRVGFKHVELPQSVGWNTYGSGWLFRKD